MSLYACLVKGLGKGTDGLVGVFAIEQVHLFEGASIGFHPCKAAHLNDKRGNAYQLVYPWLILSGRLPHVAIDEAEFDFLFHVDFGITMFL